MTDTPPPLPLPDGAASRREPAHPESAAGTVSRARRPDPGPGAVARLGREAAYLVIAFPLAIVTFVVAIVTVSGSAALVTAPFFLPVGGLVLRGLAAQERALQSWLLGRRVPRPVYASDYPTTGSAAGNLWRRVVDPQTWLEIAWGLVTFVVATVTFALTVAFGAGVMAGLSSPFWYPIVASIDGYNAFGEMWGVRPAFLIDLPIHVLAGLVSVPLLVLVVRLGSRVQSGLAAGLIGARATQARYAALQRAHSAGQEAERDSMRRLERDLHDGPQQGLVRLQMDLARAERLMDTDPTKAREILAGAGLTASSTLGELRALSRGIAPPLLVDRGLHAALMSLAGAHPAEVTIHDLIGTRLPEQAETALYFAVSEALANVAKHARARSVEVVLRRSGGMVEAAVTDDGVGGASFAKGHGLTGLERRLAGVHGTLEVTSPDGGPTVVVARVPLAGAG